MKFQVAENVNDLITQLDSGKIKSGLLWTEEELESYGLDVSGIMDSDNNGLYRVYYDNGKLRIQSDVDNSSLNIRMYNDGSYDMHNPSSGVTKAFYDNQVRFSYPDSSSKYVYDNGGYTIYDKDLNIIGKGYPNGSYEEYGEDYTKYYDVEGNLQRVDYSDGSYQIYNSGKLMTVRYPDGSYSSYDQSERLVRRKMGDYFERYDYDEDGNYTIFDENNNILEKRYINGSYEEYGEDYIKYYDVEGNLQMVNYSDGRYEEYFSNGDYAKYDKYGQYIMIGNSLSGFYSEYKYDSSGRLESIIDSDGKYTRYDADRNIIGRGYPDGRYEEYSEDYTKYYDVEGNLQRVDYSDRRYEEYGEDYIKYYDVEGNLQRVDYSDGRYEEYGEDYIKYYDENGKLISKKYEDGRYVKYKENREVLYSKTGEELLAKYYDGVVCYKIDGLNWVTYPGDYFFCELEDGTKINGTYKIDENGNVEFTNSETNETNVYDINEYKITKTIFPDGSSLEYEIDNGSILKHNSNRQLISVSNINSIDFDEERYNAIMKKLNSIYELKVGVEASYNNCISEIDAFPDKFSSFNRNSNLFDFYENIYKLKNKINYSSLAYKGYDKDLKDYLDDLIDEIFEEKNTKYLNKFQDDIKDLTNDSNNDGILDYNRDVNFKELDTEMFKSILINGYGFEILDDSSAKELGLSESDKHNIVYSPIIKNINGVDFQCYYGFNIDDIDDPKKLIEDAEECIQFTREKYNNPGVLASLKKAGLKFAFDNVYDGHGAGWYWPPYKLIKTHCIFDENKGILEHEIGHAVDYLLLPDDNDRNYRNIIENSYNSGNPMYLRINVDNTNNNYISIKYGSDGLPYCEGADGSKVLLDYNVLNNGGAVNVDGYEYVVATKKEAKKHIEEVFAETSRYNYVDTGVLLSRMMATGKDREDTYLLTADCLTWYLSEYQNEDISWYTDFLDEGDK